MLLADKPGHIQHPLAALRKAGGRDAIDVAVEADVLINCQVVIE